MNEFKTGKPNRDVEPSSSYFALKSENEIYFQMASIFSHVANDENKMAKMMLNGCLTGHIPNIFMENSF